MFGAMNFSELFVTIIVILSFTWIMVNVQEKKRQELEFTGDKMNHTATTNRLPSSKKGNLKEPSTKKKTNFKKTNKKQIEKPKPTVVETKLGESEDSSDEKLVIKATKKKKNTKKKSPVHEDTPSSEKATDAQLEDLQSGEWITVGSKKKKNDSEKVKITKADVLAARERRKKQADDAHKREEAPAPTAQKPRLRAGSDSTKAEEKNESLTPTGISSGAESLAPMGKSPKSKKHIHEKPKSQWQGWGKPAVHEAPAPAAEESGSARSVASDASESSRSADSEGSGTGDFPRRPASYAKYVGNLQGMFDKLWNEDERLYPVEVSAADSASSGASRVCYDLQARAGNGPGGDSASRNLFSYVDPEWYGSELNRSFRALLDNYEFDSSEKTEYYAMKEIAEMKTFLDNLIQTPAMKDAFGLLNAELRASSKRSKTEITSLNRRLEKVASHLKKDPSRGFVNPKDQKELLHFLWFDLYNRGGQKKSSCGFEHVFVGELVKSYDREKRKRIEKVTGVHNWLQFYEYEQRGLIDYYGSVGRGDTNSNECTWVKVRFSEKDHDEDGSSGGGGSHKSSKIHVKNLSTMLVGTSVAYEFAILTLGFLLGRENERIPLTIGGDHFDMVCYGMGDREGRSQLQVSTAYLDERK